MRRNEERKVEEMDGTHERIQGGAKNGRKETRKEENTEAGKQEMQRQRQSYKKADRRKETGQKKPKDKGS